MIGTVLAGVAGSALAILRTPIAEGACTSPPPLPTPFAGRKTIRRRRCLQHPSHWFSRHPQEMLRGADTEAEREGGPLLLVQVIPCVKFVSSFVPSSDVGRGDRAQCDLPTNVVPLFPANGDRRTDGKKFPIK